MTKKDIKEEIKVHTTLYLHGETYRTFQEYARKNQYQMTDLMREAMLEYAHTLDRRMKDRGQRELGRGPV